MMLRECSVLGALCISKVVSEFMLICQELNCDVITLQLHPKKSKTEPQAVIKNKSGSKWTRQWHLSNQTYIVSFVQQEA